MVSPEEPNPFLRLKTRSLLLWSLVSLLVLAVLTQSETVIGYGLYGVILLWVGWQIHQLGIDPRRLIGTLPRDSVWIPTIAAVIPMVLVFSVGSWLLSILALSVISPTGAQAVQQLAESAERSVTWTIGVLVAPPVEELLFRGILLHRWSVKWGLRRAVVLSSLAFALLHANSIGMFVFGCVMAVLYIRCRTLIVPIICHGLNNLVAFSLADNRQWSTLSFSQLLLLGSCSTVIAGVWIGYFLHRNWPRSDCCAPYFTASGGMNVDFSASAEVAREEELGGSLTEVPNSHEE